MWNELNEEKKRTENLAKEIEKYEILETVIISKENSYLHCNHCKENEHEYTYCIPSTILYYKTLYEIERIMREEKEKELNEYNILFEEYEKQEETKNNE